MLRLPSRTACALSLLLVALSACGQRDASLAEVRGDVTFCGQPAVAEVLFEPLNSSGQSAGRASTATSDEAGRFRLRLDDSQSGAKIGRHRVTIRVQRISAVAGKSGDLPDGLSGAIKSTHLSREVQSGDNQFHFRLTF
ncbi:MAG: hypothetical protein IAG10_08975 [Planctomycetaceae bacterium]|nr:hypothetical protein [Planctomycetaceae bacterium]